MKKGVSKVLPFTLTFSTIGRSGWLLLTVMRGEAVECRQPSKTLLSLMR
ncbi:MAG: hypothetical protein HC892_22510 [Saprospiraceae bacterium]|nr:hypothetical protein [Saprospiraceae bacterium]